VLEHVTKHDTIGESLWQRIAAQINDVDLPSAATIQSQWRNLRRPHSVAAVTQERCGCSRTTPKVDDSSTRGDVFCYHVSNNFTTRAVPPVRITEIVHYVIRYFLHFGIGRASHSSC